MYSGYGYEVLDVVGFFDNSSFCFGGGDKVVVLWDVVLGQVVCKFWGYVGKVNMVQFNEEVIVILFGFIDFSICCWDCCLWRFELVQMLDEVRDGVFSVKVLDYEILVGFVDGCVRCYDLRMGQFFLDYVGSFIICICFSWDGQCILVFSLDFILWFLDKDIGELLGEYKGYKNQEYKLDCCLSECDIYVVSCFEDGKVFFWDLVEGVLVLVLFVGFGVVQLLVYYLIEFCLLIVMGGSVQCW